MSPLTRADLQAVFGNNPKVILAFEEIVRQVDSTAKTTTANTAATDALQDATVVTLSPNATLTNERILAVDAAALTIQDTGSQVILGLVNLISTNGGYSCTFNLLADTNLDLPVSGRVPSSEDGPYADDAAAAAAGVKVGEWYAKTGGSVVWRQV